MPVLHIKARPNARHNQLAVALDGTVIVRLHAPAQDGEANACLLDYLAEVFGVSKSSLTLLSGHTTPFKKVQIGCLTEEEVRKVLAGFAS